MINSEITPNAATFNIPFAGFPITPARHVRSIAITSGKGGAGKTNLAVNVALELAALGRTVTLLDADLALANTTVLFGVNPRYNIGHVLTGQLALEDVVVNVDPRVRLIPGSSGVELMANLSLSDHKILIAEMEAMEDRSDYLLIDTASGMANNVMGVLCAASEVIVVTTPEPTSLIDAYALIKALHQHSPSKPIWVVVNNAVGIDDGEKIFAQLGGVANRFLNRSLKYLGAVVRDNDVVEAVRRQRPVVVHAPDRPASRSFRLIAKYLDKSRSNNNSGDISRCWPSEVQV